MSLYTLDGAAYVPRQHVLSFWNQRYQADFGPMALLTHHVLARMAEGFRVTRLALDVLQPVPAAALTVHCSVTGQTATTQHLEAAVVAGDRQVARAAALAIREIRIDVPEGGHAVHRNDVAPRLEYAGRQAVGSEALDVRFVSGDGGAGPACVWVRLAVDLLPGQPADPLVALSAVADVANRVAGPLPVEDYTFVNPDTTLHLHRRPQSEWVRLDAASTAGDNGVGLTTVRLADESGEFGLAVQSLVVRRREGVV